MMQNVNIVQESILMPNGIEGVKGEVEQLDHLRLNNG